MDFVHLHNHSHFSMFDGTSTSDDLFDAVQKNEMRAVALTDHNVISGANEFYKKAKQREIKPIIGIEINISMNNEIYHLLLLAKNESGYKNLLILSTIVNLESPLNYSAIDLEILKKYSSGLIATTACMNGIVSSYILKNDFDNAKKVICLFKEIFEKDFYLEIQDHRLKDEKKIINWMLKYSKEFDVKLIATNNCHYIKKWHSITQKIYSSFRTNNSGTLINLDTPKLYGDQYYFKSAEEMYKLFHNIPEACANTLEIDDKCDLKLDLCQTIMPLIKLSQYRNAENIDSCLEYLVSEGLKERIGIINSELEKRLEFEINIIKKMNYSNYFLVIHDILNLIKISGDIIINGSGTCNSSLINYALGITNINPVDFNLVFEDFLNLDRLNKPIFHFDIDGNKRARILAILKQKYGTDSVGKINAFCRITVENALENVGNYFGIPAKSQKVLFNELNHLKNKSYENYNHLTIINKLKKNICINSDQRIINIIKHSAVLTGLNYNQYADRSSIVITPNDLNNYSPLYKDYDSELTTQFNMDDLETVGLFTIEFKDQKVLTEIAELKTKSEINNDTKIELNSIPLNDEKTIQLFVEGNKEGIFQFNEPIKQKVLKILEPHSFDDLLIINALFQGADNFNINKIIAQNDWPNQIKNAHPILEKILEPTHGILIFHEQMTQIISEFTGFSLSKAALRRKGFMKREKSLLKELKSEFIEFSCLNCIKKQTAKNAVNFIFSRLPFVVSKSHLTAIMMYSFQLEYLNLFHIDKYKDL